MKPETQSYQLLAMTRSRAKMHEYFVPSRFHIRLPRDPATLLTLTVGILGDANTADSVEFTEAHRADLLFAAHYFDSYIESKLDEEITGYLFLLGAAAYYLCDLPGCSYVLINKLHNLQDVDGSGIEYLLAFLLGKTLKRPLSQNGGPFDKTILRLIMSIGRFRKTGRDKLVIAAAETLRTEVYEHGTARQLLLADTVVSVVKKQIYYSTWHGLPRFSGLDIEFWRPALAKKSFVKEFWPSQMMLGERGVFAGKSAVVQMPTSAGKTKSFEIIIRSSFLSERTDLAIVVAPFRALCGEIKNTLQKAFAGEGTVVDVPSDSLQSDFGEIEELIFGNSKLILVVTPEKLVYILRNSPELAQKVGVLIYDEGHQFDNGLRGVTYELLLASLKLLVPSTAQIVLISAVISNANLIADWLLGEGNEVILGNNLLPTYRTIAFASWTDFLGRLEFVRSVSPDEEDYYVPRVLQQVELAKLGKEQNSRLFPAKDDGKEVAIFLSLRLIKNGSVAIFCGSKASVRKIHELILDLDRRGYSVDSPINLSDPEEVHKLKGLHTDHFGNEYVLTKSCDFGVFAHSAHVPQGIRLALEYAMQEGKIKYIVCTSTLAQGVNLPIKYLLVTSFYQAGQSIKTRDFHNLIGRAGRAGLHTEGSIIFTDTELYDQKGSFRSDWKWQKAKSLLDAAKSEPCGSTLLKIFDPIYSENRKFTLEVNLVSLVEMYTSEANELAIFIGELADNNVKFGFSRDSVANQVAERIQIISAIESFLLAHWDNSDEPESDDRIASLAQRTFAYFLSGQSQKVQLVELFRLLAKNVSEKIPANDKKLVFGKTLLGVEDLVDIERWTLENVKSLRRAATIEDLLELIWPLIELKTRHNALKNLLPSNSGYLLATEWIQGTSYFDLLKMLAAAGVKVKAKTQQRNLKQEHIVDICDGAFGYDITLTVGAIRAVLESLKITSDRGLVRSINSLQKILRYGLPNLLSIAFYELGFSDRIIAQELANRFDHFSPVRSTLIKQIDENKQEVRDLLERFPSYYEYVMYNILTA